MAKKKEETFFMVKYHLLSEENENKAEVKSFDDLKDAVKFLAKSAKKIDLEKALIAKGIRNAEGEKSVEIFDYNGNSIKKIS